MAELSSLPERGCGPLSCGEIYCIVLDIGVAFIPCAWMLRVVHEQNVYDRPIDDFCLAITLGMESRGLSELGIEHLLET